MDETSFFDHVQSSIGQIAELYFPWPGQSSGRAAIGVTQGYAYYTMQGMLEDDLRRFHQAGVALELLQAYFLIHDDWMDQDLERRGGPTVHAHLGRRFRSTSKGASAAILTGDYAVALATRVLANLDLPGRRLSGVLTCFADMQLDAVAGQGLDVIGRGRDVELTYRLKTASYTVRGPLIMGALSYKPSNDRYSFPWMSDSGWAGTCRQLLLQLNDGMTYVAYFEYD